MRRKKVKVIAGLLSMVLIFADIIPTGVQVSASEIWQGDFDVADIDGEDVSSDDTGNRESQEDKGNVEEKSEENPENGNEDNSEEPDSAENECSTDVENTDDDSIEDETVDLEAGEEDNVLDDTGENEDESLENEYNQELSDETEENINNEEYISTDEMLSISAEERLSLMTSANDIASGISNNIVWVIAANGKLTITGTGDYVPCEYWPGGGPWGQYFASITSAEVNVTGMTDASNMFYWCRFMKSIDVSNFNTSKITNMSSMFAYCYELSDLDVSKFNTSNVTDMMGMFVDCSSLTSLDVTNFDTSKVTDMSGMFGRCRNLTNLDVSNFNTSNVTNMGWMFEGCSSLTSLDVTNFNTSKVTDMSVMFSGCSSLTSLDVSNFDTKNVEQMGTMSYVASLGSNLSKLEDSFLEEVSLEGMFAGCSSLTELDLGNFDTRNVKNMIGMFRDCSSLASLNISSFDTSNVTYMTGMFLNCSSLTEINIDNFNTGNVVEMLWMFYGCTKLKSLDLSSFNTGNVTDMACMFMNCSSLKDLDISKFNTSKVKNMQWMFNGCSSLQKLDLSGFDASNAVDQSESYFYDNEMFYACTNLLTINTPRNLSLSVVLPARQDDAWYDSDSKKITELPKNLSYSKTLRKNYIPGDIPVINELTLGGSQSVIKVDDDFPIFGGKEFNIDLPASLPVSCVLEDGKIKIGINIKKESLYSYSSNGGVTTTTKKKTIKEEFEDFKKNALKADLMARDEDWLKNIQDKNFLKANIPGIEGAVTLNWVGYVEGAWSDHLDTLQGSVVVTIKGSATVQAQMLVWIIPVTVNCELSASGRISADVGYDFSNAKWYGDLELAANIGVEPYAGIGFGQWFSGGVYGKGQSDFNIVLLSSHKALGLEKWTLSGEAGLKGYFAKKSVNIPLIDGDEYTIIENYEKVNAKSKSIQSDAYVLDEKTSIVNTVIVTTLDATSGLLNSSVGTDGVLVSDVYNAAKPSLVTAGGTTMLVYVADDLTRNPINQTKLVYSIYDADTGTYSDAMSVLDDNTADYEPEVFTDGENIYVAWLDSAKIFGSADDPELMDYMKTFRTRVAKYNPVTKSFEDLGSPQTGENYTYLPKLYVSDGNLQLIWVENSDNTLYGLSANNTIRRAIYANGGWVVADEISRLNSVTSMDIGETDFTSGIAIAYTLDLDNDLATGEHDLYVRSGGNSAKVDTGNISAVSYTELPGVTSKVLAVNINGGLYYLEGNAFVQLLPEGTMNVDTQFRASGNSIIYILSGNENRNLAIATYDNGEWGTALLTHEEKYVDSFSVMNGKVSYLYSNATHMQDGVWEVISDIKILESFDYDDVELETVDFALEDVNAGVALPVELYIKNNGVSRVTKVHASVAYAGSEISSSDVDVNIMPGEVKPYDYSFTIPSDLSTSGDFTVTVMCDGDKNSGNNSQILSLMKADLEVSASYDGLDSAPYITVMVRNRGLLDSNMEMTIKDDKGNLLFSGSGLVKAGDNVVYKEAYTAGKTQILTIDVKGDAEEFYEMNNTTWLRVGNQGDDMPDGSDDVLPEDVPEDGIIPEGIWIAGVTEDGYAYTGSAIKPEIRVYDHRTLLKEKTDYTIAYKNNIKSNDASVVSKAPTITVTGRGNYSGKDSKTFKILALDISEESIDGIFETDDISVVYSGKAQKPAPVLYWNGKKLKNKTDYTYTYYKGVYEGTDTEEIAFVKELGSYYIKLTGIGNFTGTRRIKLKVLDSASLKPISKATVKKIANQSYQTQYKDGGITPEVTVKYGSETLTPGTHYTVSYSHNTKVGTAYVVIKGIEENGYSGTKRVSFKITGIAIKKATVKGLSDKTFIYSGVDIKPNLTLSIKINGQERTLVPEIDYKVTWQNNQSAGKATAVITGLGGYTGTVKKTFKIKAFNVAENAEERFVAALENDTVPYAKGGAKPALKVTFTKEDGTVQTLIEGKDYTLTCKNNTAVNDGSNTNKIPTVTIKGKGSFSGIYATKPTYKIEAQNIGNLTFSAADKTFQNKKNKYATSVIITDINGKKLKAGTDYDKNFSYVYKKNTTLTDGTIRNAGTDVDKNDIIPAGTVLEVAVNGKKNYSGTIKCEYRITKASISGVSVSIPKQAYTGKAITLSKEQITVKVNGKQLDADQYEIISGSYKNNVKKGTASVTIKGVGNYGGTKTVKFTIRAKGFLWWWRN